MFLTDIIPAVPNIGNSNFLAKILQRKKRNGKDADKEETVALKKERGSAMLSNVEKERA